jgi:hypothetical protein
MILVWYTPPDEKEAILNDFELENFQKKHPYAFIRIKENNNEVPDDIAEWYFRSIHNMRMERIPDLFVGRTTIKRELTAICRSHGYDVKEILNDDDITNFQKEIAGLVFCAVILRLADILDFDQTRAPAILFDFLKLKESDKVRSREEYLKHGSSLGFVFPDQRIEGWKVLFSAKCDNIEIEHDIRQFLDIIDKELSECRKLLSNRSAVDGIILVCLYLLIKKQVMGLITSMENIFLL